MWEMELSLVEAQIAGRDYVEERHVDFTEEEVEEEFITSMNNNK
jgi:hypothetical protein